MTCTHCLTTARDDPQTGYTEDVCPACRDAAEAHGEPLDPRGPRPPASDAVTAFALAADYGRQAAGRSDALGAQRVLACLAASFGLDALAAESPRRAGWERL